MAWFHIRPVTRLDRPRIAQFIEQHWGADQMVVHGTIFNISQLPGMIAEQSGEWLGLITYHIANDECEITSIDSLRPGTGIGSALIDAVKKIAQAANCRRLFLSTTNDNIEALRFYQKRGFVLCELRPNAVTEARKIKPQIPAFGNHGIPIRDELELEIDLLT